jgi:hypothetical protein
MTKNTIYEYWREFRTQRKPMFLKIQGGGKQRKSELIFELALIFPNNRWATKTYYKDSMGRNMEALIEDEKFRIKEVIPYWKEELIFDHQLKKKIRYHEMVNNIIPITEIAQIFT